jgi:hypothetical protein
MDPVISVVVPMHNEKDGLARLFDVLSAELTDTGQSYEIICVNDGSRDQTLLGCWLSWHRLPWVDDLHACRFKIRNISRNDWHSVGDPCRGDQGVPVTAGVWNMQSGTAERDRPVYG